MSKRERVIARLPVSGNTEVNSIDIELRYSLGGTNWATYQPEPRGLYLSVTPVYRGDDFVRFTAFSGIKHCVKGIKRFSEKALNSFEIDSELINLMITKVVFENNIKPESVDLGDYQFAKEYLS